MRPAPADPAKIQKILRDKGRLAAFRAKVATFVAPRDAFAATVVEAVGCRGLIFPTLSYDAPLAGIPLAFKEDMRVRALLRRKPVAALTPTPTPAAPARPDFTVLGQGYNALTGARRGVCVKGHGTGVPRRAGHAAVARRAAGGATGAGAAAAQRAGGHAGCGAHSQRPCCTCRRPQASPLPGPRAASTRGTPWCPSC